MRMWHRPREDAKLQMHGHCSLDIGCMALVVDLHHTTDVAVFCTHAQAQVRNSTSTNTAPRSASTSAIQLHVPWGRQPAW